MYVLYVCLDSYSHCPVSCSLLSWLKRKTIIFLCCQERRRRRGWHSINALMVGVTPSVCLWCVVAVCGTHMSTLSPFVCVYVPWCILRLFAMSICFLPHPLSSHPLLPLHPSFLFLESLTNPLSKPPLTSIMYLPLHALLPSSPPPLPLPPPTPFCQICGQPMTCRRKWSRGPRHP